MSPLLLNNLQNKNMLFLRAILATGILIATVETTNLLIASVSAISASGYGRWREAQVNQDHS
jgi:hypothetical protein